MPPDVQRIAVNLATRKTSPIAPRPAPAAGTRVASRVFLLAMVAFIVYGSLYPFDFLPEPATIDHFYAEWHMFDNRSDAIDNFMLFVPLGIGLHVHYASLRARAVASVLAVLVLAVGIQLVQLYLPSRTAAVSDALWNTVGMVAGLLMASRVHPLVAARMSRDDAGHDFFALLMLMLWFFYESFPFVPTLDLGELRSHVKTVVMAPPFELMRLMQHGLGAALAGVAVQRTNWLRTPRQGVLVVGAMAVTMEILVAYGSLRRETLLGIVLGMLGAYWLERKGGDVTHGTVFVIAVVVYLITVFTPYRGQGADGGVTLTPFRDLMWVGGTREIVPAAYEALAIGALFWSGLASKRLQHAGRLWVGAVLLAVLALEWVRTALAGYHGDTSTIVMAIVLAPAALALRRHAPPALRHAGEPGPTAGWAPHAVPDLAHEHEHEHEHEHASAHGHTRAPAHAPAHEHGHASGPAPAPAHAHETRTPERTRAAAALWVGLSLVGLTVAMWFLVSLPSIPYNLKKLFGSHTLLGPGVFSLALMWLGAGPWLVVGLVVARQRRARSASAWLPLMLAALALVSYLLVDFATPSIMLEKIIGAPDLYRRIVVDGVWGEAWRSALAAWPAALLNPVERLLRYIALYSVFMVPLVLAMLAVPKGDRRPRVLSAAIVLLPCWWLAKVVVLDWSITDNLTELLAPGGAWLLALVIALFAVHASLLGRHAQRPGAAPALLALTVAALPASWFLFKAGMETAVINGDRIFSAVQFVLGPNRAELLSPLALFTRWCVLYGAAVAVTALGMAVAVRLLPPAWAEVRAPRPPRPRAAQP